MNLTRKLAAVLAGVGIAPFIVVVSAGTASAHGYISSPPSRQAMCAQGRVTDCGPIMYEPQSVEGPKGQRNCHGGLGQFAVLNDDNRNWPTTSVGNTVSFNWTLTARHATSTWQYYIGDSKIAEFNDGGRQPGATVTHSVDLGGRTGRQKVLAVWNIADTPNAFYACVDLQVGGGGTTPTTTTKPPTTTTTPPTTTTSRPTTTTQPPAGGTWAANTAYAVGSQVTYGGASYRCIQAHTSLTGWEPPNTPALWQRL
ncbi:lytic polysaccharide monooxygenase [Saccharothrix coeruleofusca]|uniref:Cellulose-binding protein n=1 Tax=Saccharothrix coeruleofusca TaxID=33919 RepID=A0A918EF90_9PSEU|nr:lytic polysaccharide monooxygenase [Saccharothrix coeruleofusca]MBP2337938.1 chitin-binding protein [Saccharothrix coeruleofusca]GGP63193.1 cellulose-binding protein [Saccharothrix coeruleofusca]